MSLLKYVKSVRSWQYAFEYARNIRVAYQCSPDPFTLADVKEIKAYEEGENDGPKWVCMGKLKDGRWFYLSAGCDYTGWDCQASGDAQVADTKRNLIRYAMDLDGRRRLDVPLKDDA